MNYNAEIMQGIGYLAAAILQVLFPYVLAALGYRIIMKVLRSILK